jgi:hypothetical protein
MARSSQVGPGGDWCDGERPCIVGPHPGGVEAPFGNEVSALREKEGKDPLVQKMLPKGELGGLTDSLFFHGGGRPFLVV